MELAGGVSMKFDWFPGLKWEAAVQRGRVRAPVSDVRITIESDWCVAPPHGAEVAAVR